MVHFTDINQTSPPYSMLQDVGREATSKLATANCPKYLHLQTTGWYDNGVREVGLRIYVRYCLKR